MHKRRTRQGGGQAPNSVIGNRLLSGSDFDRGDASASKSLPLSDVLGGDVIADDKEPGFGSWIWLFLIYWLALASLTTYRHYNNVPVPKLEEFGSDGRPQFSEIAARKNLRVISEDIGLRVVGTRQEKETVDFILKKLNAYKDAAKDNPYVPQFDIFVDTVHGSHMFNLFRTDIYKSYTNVTNIVVRLSCGEVCNSHAILMSSHFDTNFMSPGAADDGIGVVVMLELVRIMSLRQTEMKNAAIFLFNGAEESLQDATHAFATNSNLRTSIRAFVNVEAMGQAGREILFQSNSADLIKAYARVPHPHGAVLSSDIFRTGVVGSDTDYRQFVDHLGLIGLDMALYQKSYAYHTMLDTEANLQMGTVQNMGENTLALMEYFVTEAPLETFKKGNDLIFFDFLGFILIHYPWWFAVIIHYAAIAWAGYVIFHPLVRAMVVPKRKIMPILSGLWERFLSVMSVGISVTSAIMGTLFVAMIMNGALNKAMTYFAQEWYTLVLYGPAALAGMVFSEIGSRNFFRRRGLSIEITVSYGERRTYIGLIGVLAFLLYIMTSARIGSAFIVFIMLTSMLLGLAVDSILQPLPSKSTTTAAASSSAGAGKKRAAMSPVPITDKRAIHPAAYFVASTLPCIILTEVSWGLLDLLVPLTGRLGAQTAVDAIVSVVVGVLVAFHFALFIPLSHRLADDRLQQCFEIFLALTVTVVIFFCTAMFPFDEMHPKRVYVQYMENATSGQRAINIGIADPGPLSPVLDAVEKHLGVKPVKRTPLDVMQDWNIFFPFSRYMESYQFDITSKLPVTTENNAPILTIKEIEDENAGDGSKRKTREVLIQCYHPQHISTCVMLDGIQIIDWSLDAEVPEDLKYKKIQDVKPTSSNKPRRLYVRHAGGYISNTWNMTLTVPASNKFWVEVSGIERDSYHQLVQPSASDGASPKLGRSWAWSDRWETSRILGGVADAMPDWVTAYYASTDLMAVAQS